MEKPDKNINQLHITIITPKKNKPKTFTTKIKNIMKKIKSIFTICSLLLLFMSCTKEGPAGPKGDPGSAGATGATGATGDANIHSEHFSVASWQKNNGNSYWYYNFTSSILPNFLTSDVQANGTVQVFLSTDGGITYIALPYTSISTAGTPYYWTFTTSPGYVYLQFNTDNGAATNPNTYYGTTCAFKVVVIP